MLIKAKKLSKVYGSGENQVVALDKVDLTVAPGDFISIIGPSGSGKSTLLHLLSGLDHPTSGSLTYDGQEIYTLPDKELSAFRRRQMGFIFQQFNLLPVLTARENILMPLLLDKKQPDEGYLSQLAELLGIRNRLDHLPHVKSGALSTAVQIPAEHLQVCVRYQARLISVLHSPEPQKIQDAQGLKLGAPYGLIQPPQF